MNTASYKKNELKNYLIDCVGLDDVEGMDYKEQLWYVNDAGLLKDFNSYLNAGK